MNRSKRLHAQEATPSYNMETYDRHGNLQKIELLRTLSYEEWQFELARYNLPVAEVITDTGPAYPAGTFDNDGSFEAVT